MFKRNLIFNQEKKVNDFDSFADESSSEIFGLNSMLECCFKNDHLSRFFPYFLG